MQTRPPSESEGIESRARTFARYCLISGLSFSLNLSLTALLHEVVGASEVLAFGAALVVVFLLNFMFMRYYIFAGTTRSCGPQLIMFSVSSLCFRGGEYVVFIVIQAVIGPPYLASIGTILVVSFLTKFVLYHTVVFKRHSSQDGGVVHSVGTGSESQLMKSEATENLKVSANS